MKYNYHTHTSRCNHAIGSDEQYILSAIKANYNGIGITDHVMLPFIKSSYVRASYEQKDEYINSIRILQKKYEGQIEIYLGFECEWDNHYQKYYRQLLDNKEVDYLIFGNHFVAHKKGSIYTPKDIWGTEEFVYAYIKRAKEAMESKLFKVFIYIR